MKALSSCSVMFVSVSPFFCRGLTTDAENLREGGGGLANVKEAGYDFPIVKRQSQ